MAWMRNYLKTYPRLFVQTGDTHFFIYRSHMPKVMREAFSICATYSAMTDSNKFTVLSVIEAKVGELIADDMYSWSWSMADNLGYVQALILTQIIQLFDGDIRQRVLGEEHETLLTQWTQRLQFQQQLHLNDLEQRTSQSWVFTESVRRAIIMSYVLRGLYSFCKLGHCDATVIDLARTMRQLQFTAQAPLWEEKLSQGTEVHCSQQVISYAELEGIWENRSIVHFQPFERFLLVACKGEECSDFIHST